MVLPRSRSAPVRLRYSFSQVSADHPPRGNLRLAAGGLHLVNGAHNNTITSDTFTGTASTSRLLPVVSKLLARAQAGGSVRADPQPTDIPLIEFMLAMLAEYVHPVRPGVWRRYLAIILDGLRPSRATLPDGLVETSHDDGWDVFDPDRVLAVEWRASEGEDGGLYL
jgi:hypothetical protein